MAVVFSFNLPGCDRGVQPGQKPLTTPGGGAKLAVVLAIGWPGTVRFVPVQERGRAYPNSESGPELGSCMDHIHREADYAGSFAYP